MAKMVGMNVVIKEGWTKKVIALLSENLTEEEYKAALNQLLWQRQNGYSANSTGSPQNVMCGNCCDICAAFYCANCVTRCCCGGWGRWPTG